MKPGTPYLAPVVYSQHGGGGERCLRRGHQRQVHRVPGTLARVWHRPQQLRRRAAAIAGHLQAQSAQMQSASWTAASSLTRSQQCLPLGAWPGLTLQVSCDMMRCPRYETGSTSPVQSTACGKPAVSLHIPLSHGCLALCNEPHMHPWCPRRQHALSVPGPEQAPTEPTQESVSCKQHAIAFGADLDTLHAGNPPCTSSMACGR